jgi:hypothetical protein
LALFSTKYIKTKEWCESHILPSSTIAETTAYLTPMKLGTEYKQKNWIRNLAIEVDAAINLLNPHEQAYMRQAVMKNLQKLINKETQTEKRNTHAARTANTEKKLIQNLQDKLEQNNLILTKADKGNTVIVVQKDVYHNKINDFISQHKFTKVRNNYTNIQQKAIKIVINACKLTIGRHEKWKYINMNPKAPHIFGNIKLHKADQPIRPTVNLRNSPGYKLAVYVAKILKQKIRLLIAFNVQNSKILMNDLKQLEVHSNIKACSFDIKNMYTSIPIDKLTNIIHRLLTHNNIPDEHIHEIIILTKVILDQNYFQYNNELYSQKEGLAMGAPTSSI